MHSDFGDAPKRLKKFLKTTPGFFIEIQSSEDILPRSKLRQRTQLRLHFRAHLASFWSLFSRLQG
jgi:hypothetical protein